MAKVAMAEVVEGRQLTSWPSVRKDLENAGATWVDREVVLDGNLITSRGRKISIHSATPSSSGSRPAPL